MITVQGHGRLTRDPELRELQDGTKLATLRIAADDSRGRTVYCAEFGKPGEATARHLRKGSEVVFYGELRFREADTDNGRREYYSAVVHIEFAGRRNGDQPTAPAEVATPDALAGYATARRQEIRVLDWTHVDLKVGAVELAADEEGRKPGGS
jgi:single-stranded DNA-binding protein